MIMKKYTIEVFGDHKPGDLFNALASIAHPTITTMTEVEVEREFDGTWLPETLPVGKTTIPCSKPQPYSNAVKAEIARLDRKTLCSDEIRLLIREELYGKQE